MTNEKNMMEQVTGAFLWPWPKKPLGKAPGKNAKGMPKQSGSKPGGKMRGSRGGKGMRRKGGGNAGTIFAGWD